MTTEQLTPVIRYIRKITAEQRDEDLKDCQLLDRFVGHGEETAFAALLRHHGPMVLRVCRRVLCHEQDAEDAFQAAFLVLARKAASIRKRASVGSWLHGVAYRVSVKAKTSLNFHGT